MIGLFLGDTDFSEIILNKIKRLKKKYFILDYSKNHKFKKDKNSYRISIGKFGEIIKLIKSKKSKKVLFAGKIAKPNFSSLRLDLKGIYYMPSVIRASKIGDAAIIKSIINILAKEGIKVISSTFFSPEISLKKGNYSKTKPTRNDIRSIQKDEKIIAKESSLGTKKMLSKLKKNSKAILIKFPKNKQDLRIDLPTIGLQTIKDIKKYGCKGLVLKSKRNIFLNKNEVISFANKNKIFIKVI